PLSHLSLHSFPTRRSSDLRRRSGRWSNTRRISNGCAARALGSFLPGPSMPDAGAVLTRNWLHFGRILRGLGFDAGPARMLPFLTDRKSTRLNSSHQIISYA